MVLAVGKYKYELIDQHFSGYNINSYKLSTIIKEDNFQAL
jgi:hypothetical protein